MFKNSLIRWSNHAVALESQQQQQDEKERLRGAADRMQPHILTDDENNPHSNRNIKPMTIKIIHAAIEI